MLDGGDIQTLWEYGPKGYYYEEQADGSFKFLGKKTNPKTLYAKAHLDCNLVLANFTNGKDPGKLNSQKCYILAQICSLNILHL